jgi:metal-sulfur cluster biosynthetic enzyme
VDGNGEEGGVVDPFQKACVEKVGFVPEVEVKFDDVRMWRFDYAWPEYKVALEVEGGAFTRGRHTRGVGFVNDLTKYSEAAIQGWLVLRLTPTDLPVMGVELAVRALTARGCPVPAAVVREIEEQRAARLARQKQNAVTARKIRRALKKSIENGPNGIPKRSEKAGDGTTRSTRSGSRKRRQSGAEKTKKRNAA